MRSKEPARSGRSIGSRPGMRSTPSRKRPRPASQWTARSSLAPRPWSPAASSRATSQESPKMDETGTPVCFRRTAASAEAS